MELARDRVEVRLLFEAEPDIGRRVVRDVEPLRRGCEEHDFAREERGRRFEREATLVGDVDAEPFGERDIGAAREGELDGERRRIVRRDEPRVPARVRELVVEDAAPARLEIGVGPRASGKNAEDCERVVEDRRRLVERRRERAAEEARATGRAAPGLTPEVEAEELEARVAIGNQIADGAGHRVAACEDRPADDPLDLRLVGAGRMARVNIDAQRIDACDEDHAREDALRIAVHRVLGEEIARACLREGRTKKAR